jgi:hypothetical protein
MVLVTVILAVLLMSALLAGVFYSTTEHTRIGVATVRRETAIADAESAIADGVGFLLQPDLASSPLGVAVPISDASKGTTVVYITRLDSTLYSIVADVAATAADAAASTRIGLVVARSVDASHSIRVVRIPDHAWSQLF